MILSKKPKESTTGTVLIGTIADSEGLIPESDPTFQIIFGPALNPFPKVRQVKKRPPAFDCDTDEADTFKEKKGLNEHLLFQNG